MGRNETDKKGEKMDIKLIALDLDGTLITETTGISDQDKAAVKRAQDAGIHVCLASGRAFNALRPFYDELGLKGITISSGGANIQDADWNVLYEQTLDPVMAAEVMRFAYESGYYAQAYVNGDYFYFTESPFTELYKTRTGTIGVLDPELPNKDTLHSTKILMIHHPEEAEKILSIVKKRFPKLSVKRSFLDFIEINDPECSKGHAMKEVEKLLGIKPEEVMAIGDSEIDISMIEYAGIGIAMENADEAVKQAADYITAHVRESGVAQAIEKFCF